MQMHLKNIMHFCNGLRAELLQLDIVGKYTKPQKGLCKRLMLNELRRPVEDAQSYREMLLYGGGGEGE